MKQKIISLFQDTFYQLLSLYSLFILLIALGLFWKYSLEFHIFAFIIGILGISILFKEKQEFKLNKKLHYFLLILSLTFCFLIRKISYLSNSIPLGYDVGIYKYAIECASLNNCSNWVYNGITPLFFYLSKIFMFFFSIEFILKELLILFCVLLGISIYFVVKEYSNKNAALISTFLYSFSIIQFNTFAMMYYKNIIAFIPMLWAIYFLKKSEENKKYLIPFIISGAITGAIHRGVFYIFGLSYFFYAFVSPYKNKKYNLNQLYQNVLCGATILFFACSFYFGKFKYMILNSLSPLAESFVETGSNAGTFMNFFTYQFSSLVYLPLALLGLFYFLRKKQFNLFIFWAIFNLCIVYFQFFAFNRMIIMLDLVLIILAGIGANEIIKHKRIIGSLVIIFLIISSGIISYNNAKESSPLITQNELNAIKTLQNTEENAFVMATSSIYSPWVQGYSNRKTIAPGLFDYNLYNKEEWIRFWYAENITQIKNFLEKYEKPLYIHIGKRQPNFLEQFDSCFEIYYENSNNFIYRYIC